MITISKLRELIRENTRRVWIEQEPDEDCFDYSEANMAMLTALIEQDARVDVQPAKDHLIACTRCRYLYGVMRKISPPA